MKKYLVLFLIFALMCNSSLAFASAYMPANHELSVMIGDFSDDGVATISGKFIAEEELFTPMYGSFIIELKEVVQKLRDIGLDLKNSTGASFLDDEDDDESDE